MIRVAYLVPFLFIATPLLIPTATACSLVGHEPFSRNQWIDDRFVLTPYYGGVGVFDTQTKNFTLGFSTLYVSHAVASPDGQWLVISYWNGALDADCSHDVETVDAFHMTTHERHALLDSAASAFAPTADGLGVFGPQSDRILFYEWGQWETPTSISFKVPDRPDVKADKVSFAALTPARDWAAVFSDGRVLVIDLLESSKKIMYESSTFYPGENPFAFSPDATKLAWVATYDESTLKVLKLDRTGVEQIASRSEPSSENGPILLGSAVWDANGIVVPMSDRLRAYADPTRLNQFTDIALHGEPRGESDWSPNKTKLFVGGRISTDSEHWLPAYWIMDKDLDVIDNHTMASVQARALDAPWKDVPQGNDDPRDDKHNVGVGHREPELWPPHFAPGAGFLTVLLLVAVALFTARKKVAEKP